MTDDLPPGRWQYAMIKILGILDRPEYQEGIKGRDLRVKIRLEARLELMPVVNLKDLTVDEFYQAIKALTDRTLITNFADLRTFRESYKLTEHGKEFMKSIIPADSPLGKYIKESSMNFSDLLHQVDERKDGTETEAQ